MATTNIDEAGWFYHAPAKRQPQERAVDYPPASQIPGLGEYSAESDQPSPPPQLVFKDTDTKYIRLAKMGGRKDLLCMNPRANLKEKEPVGYPRNDWFYLEDNAVEDAAEKRDLNWQFLLPDYMVHEEHHSDPGSGSPGERKRPMYGYDKLTAFQREGEMVTDKTVKLPELRRPGYGVRNSKPVKVIMKQPSRVVRLRGHPAPSQQTSAKPRSSGAVASGDRHAQMDMILANKYQQEWQDSHQRSPRSPRHVPCKPPAVQSEYKEAYGLVAKASAKERKKSAHSSKNLSPLPLEKSAGKSSKQEEVEKERFILSRFKKVGSKIDSHQKPKSMIAAN